MLIYLTGDLMLGSKVSALARQRRLPLRIVSTVAQARGAADAKTRQIIVDLQHLAGAGDQDPPQTAPTLAQLVALVAEPGPYPAVIAYAQHVKKPLLAGARNISGVQVMTRGQFDQSIGQLLDTVAGRCLEP